MGFLVYRKMLIWMGPVSSIFDIITYKLFYILSFVTQFAVVLWCTGVNSVLFMALFHAGWFVESLWSQTLVIHMIRTLRFHLSKQNISACISHYYHCYYRRNCLPYTLGAGFGYGSFTCNFIFAWLAEYYICIWYDYCG